MKCCEMVRASVCMLIWGMAVGTAWSQAPLVGLIRIPGTAVDESGLTGTLETGTPQNALGGFSAIEYSGEKDRYWVLSDRGAGDGAASFQCRFHEIEFSVGTSLSESRFELVASTILQSQEAIPFTGSLQPLRSWSGSGHPPSLDPEGIRRASGELLLISDEYGPSIDWFDRQGRLRRSLAVPQHFGLSDRNTPAMTVGTFPNRGFEGISLSPDGRWLVAAMQGPLVQDGRIEKSKCLGMATRWLVYDTQRDSFQEWLYPLDDESTGVSEVLAIDARRFLVLERDSRSGSDAKVKKIYLADASSASDISAVSSLRGGLPEGQRVIAKRLLVDLMFPEYGLSGDATPEKPEGLAWGPSTPDGKRLLVVCFDNDFEPKRESLLAAFRIDAL